MARFSRTVVLTVVAALLPAGALAQEPDQQRAREEYETARRLDAEGRTEEALTHAWNAYRYFPGGASRYAVAVLYERLERADEAARHYRMALGEPEPPSDAVRARIEEALGRLGALVEPLPPEPPPASESADPEQTTEVPDPAEAARSLPAPRGGQTPPDAGAGARAEDDEDDEDDVGLTGRWWFWAGLGGIAAVTAVILIVALGGDSNTCEGDFEPCSLGVP